MDIHPIMWFRNSLTIIGLSNWLIVCIRGTNQVPYEDRYCVNPLVSFARDMLAPGLDAAVPSSVVVVDPASFYNRGTFDSPGF